MGGRRDMKGGRVVRGHRRQRLRFGRPRLAECITLTGVHRVQVCKPSAAGQPRKLRRTPLSAAPLLLAGLRSPPLSGSPIS